MDKDHLRNILALIERSPDVGDGWRKVSDVVWPHIQGLPAELVEYGEQQIRMTDSGWAVLTFGR